MLNFTSLLLLLGGSERVSSFLNVFKLIYNNIIYLLFIYDKLIGMPSKTIYIPKELYTKLEVLSEIQRKPINKIIVEILSKYIDVYINDIR